MTTTTDPARVLRAADTLRRVMAQLDIGQVWTMRSGAAVRRDSVLAWSFVYPDGRAMTGTVGQLVGHALRERLEQDR